MLGFGDLADHERLFQPLGEIVQAALEARTAFSKDAVQSFSGGIRSVIILCCHALTDSVGAVQVT